MRSICILRLSAIGDVVNACAVVQAIQRQYPEAAITWVIGKVEAKLLEGLSGVRLVVFDKKQGRQAYLQLKRDLQGEVFDCLLHMQLAFRANLASVCIKAKRKIGFDWHSSKELHSLFMSERIEAAPRGHVLDGFRQFAKAIGVEFDRPYWQLPVSAEDTQFALKKLDWLPSLKKIAICPAASNAERNWLPERYAAMADYAARRGFSVVLCGGSSAIEQQMSMDIKRYANTEILDLTGKTSLKQLLAVLKSVSLVLAPDTGPVHMAVAVGTPVIGLYAHSNPDRTGPYHFRDYVVEVYHQSLLEQTGKLASELKWGTRVKGAELMQKISVEQVQQMFDKMVQDLRL
ncbi:MULTISPECIES: glycosyltransferase family 9 protein [Rheinheimera]|uniref:Glycosyltransferase family 9 protein n=1 Tax=Rheinheimera marina TaxID=1774958 RepID=A0ABV9JJQ9_9GAMM